MSLALTCVLQLLIGFNKGMMMQHNMDEFKTLCESFFAGKDFSAWAHLSTEKFMEAYQKTSNEYNDKCYGVVREFVRFVRAKDSEALNTEANQIILNAYRTIYENTFDKFVSSLSYVKAQQEKWQQEQEAIRIEKSLHISVNGKEFKALAVCDVLWAGWECDDKAWVVYDDGVNKLVTSNHGQLEFADAQFLENKIQEYKTAIENSQQLLNLIQS